MHDAPTRIPYFYMSAFALTPPLNPTVIFTCIPYLTNTTEPLTIRMHPYETH